MCITEQNGTYLTRVKWCAHQYFALVARIAQFNFGPSRHKTVKIPLLLRTIAATVLWTSVIQHLMQDTLTFDPWRDEQNFQASSSSTIHGIYVAPLQLGISTFHFFFL
jgi:hypothetical protein